MQQGDPERAVNPLPPVVVVLFLAMAVPETLFSLGAAGVIGGPEAIGWRNAAVQTFAFSGDVFDWMVTNRIWPADQLMRFVTYPFVHFSLTHAAIAGVFILALGKMVAEKFGQWQMAVIFFASAAFGALLYGLLLNDPYPLAGAFPPAYGLVGAFTFLLWRGLGALGENQVRAFTLIGVLLGVQLLFGLLFGGSPDWVADLGGFAAGFALSFVLAPGGWGAIRARIRHD
ncbi:MAG: rhomboid family intramembrane serine protease [Marinibacterium sp.]